MLGVAAGILGDDTPFTLTTSNPGAPAITPTFSTFSAFSDAINEARVNIGFHFRSCCELSQRVGYSIANAIVANALRPVQGSEFVNLSVRGNAGKGGETLIAGFIVDVVPKQVLIRGIGPRLASFGVTGALADPKITVYDSAGHIVAENDNWSSTGAVDIATLIEATVKSGGFPLVTDSKDSALLVTLQPGAYSVHVSGAGGTSGIALLEIYQVP
jgi:hypothetical protein